ncbi:MAG: TIGR01777 family protein [Thermoleophilaceae bacterium]|nr:TIGR01777 family protein [Thermoleophilaceae bacterium]
MAAKRSARRVAVTGASGNIGSALARALRERGDEVVEISRSKGWDPKAGQPAPLEGCDAVVHLAGAPVAQRWSDEAKAEIRASRILGTRSVVASIERCDRPIPLISQSATGYYGPRGDEPVDETAPPGTDFLAGVTVAWEEEASKAPGRVARCRTGVVLDQNGGALKTMLPFFKAGLGGPVAGGRQWMPWISTKDEVAALIFCLDNEEVEGAVNLVAPRPVTNKAFSKALGRALRRPALAPVPAFAIKLLYGEMASIVTTGVRAEPRALEGYGFEFAFPFIDVALESELA